MSSIINATTTAGVTVTGDNSGSLQLATNNGTTAVTIDTSQNVGIGTTSPATKAEISGTAASANIALRITNTDASGYSTLQMGDGNAGIYRNGSSQSGYAGTSSLNLITVGAHNIGFSTQNTLRAIIDSSGNVGIGSTSSGNKFEVAGSGMFSGAVTTNTTGTHISYQSSNSQIGAWGPDASTNGTLVFYSARSNGSNGLERMRIDSNGALLVGTTTVYNTATTNVGFVGNVGSGISVNTTTATNGATFQVFLSTGTLIGSIINNNNTGVSYNTTSDYRLKENIAPMTGALAVVQQLKPVTYTWKLTGEASQGFIAHELQAIVPDCVTGEKDAVETYTDEDGNEQTRIKPQGVDTSFLVATLTAAIQELKAELDATKAEVQALKGVA